MWNLQRTTVLLSLHYTAYRAEIVRHGMTLSLNSLVTATGAAVPLFQQ